MKKKTITRRKITKRKHIRTHYKRFRKRTFRKRSNFTHKISGGGLLSMFKRGDKGKQDTTYGVEYPPAYDVKDHLEYAVEDDAAYAVEDDAADVAIAIETWVNNLIPDTRQQNIRDKMTTILLDALNSESNRFTIYDINDPLKKKQLNTSLIELINTEYQKDNTNVEVIVSKLENEVVCGDIGHQIASAFRVNNHIKQKDALIKAHSKVNKSIQALKNKEDKSNLNVEITEYLNAIVTFNDEQNKALIMLGTTLRDIKKEIDETRNMRMTKLASDIQIFNDLLDNVEHTSPIYTSMAALILVGDDNERIVRKYILDYITYDVITIIKDKTDPMFDKIVNYLKRKINEIINDVTIDNIGILRLKEVKLLSDLNQRQRSNSWCD